MLQKRKHYNGPILRNTKHRERIREWRCLSITLGCNQHVGLEKIARGCSYLRYRPSRWCSRLWCFWWSRRKGSVNLGQRNVHQGTHKTRRIQIEELWSSSQNHFQKNGHFDVGARRCPALEGDLRLEWQPWSLLWRNGQRWRRQCCQVHWMYRHCRSY